MLARCRPFPPIVRLNTFQYAARRELSLAYTLHEPPKNTSGHHERPIIIMHGLFGSKQNNRSISKALARDLGVPIYAIDLRNHGDSPHDPEHTYTAMADDVEQFIDEHKLSSATLIGHSMGAKVAMVVALRNPEKVASLVPVDNAPVDAVLKSDFHKYVRGMRKVLEAKVTKQSEADEILKEVEESVPIRQFLLTNLTRDPEKKQLVFRIPLKTLGDALDNMGDFPYKDPHNARYKGRTLVIRGSKSHYVADDVLPLIGEFFPAFRVVDIDSGHWVISEKPEAFKQAVVEFLQSRD